MANKGQKWTEKVDSFFNRLSKSKKALGTRMEKVLTVLMFASIIILIITVVYVITSNKNGRTNWAMQLQNIEINQLIEAPHEIVVIDYSKDGSDETAFSKVEIARLKASGKRVYAYLSIGEAEDYRFYWKEPWQNNPPRWLASENGNWEGNYLVKYWEEGWREIIFEGENNYLDKIQDAGFDGVYLDKVDSYESWEDICYAKEEENENTVPDFCFEYVEPEVPTEKEEDGSQESSQSESPHTDNTGSIEGHGEESVSSSDNSNSSNENREEESQIEEIPESDGPDTDSDSSADNDSAENITKEESGNEPTQISLPRKRMAEFVIDLSKEGRERNPDFKVFIQHGYDILEDENVWDAIDGVGKEELFFVDGQERSEEEINYDIAILDQVVAADKMVLVVEYISDKDQINTLCSQTQIHKYVPFAGNLELDSLPSEKVCK